ncbi:MAG: AIDA repeat-containing protein, partial [Lentisphaeria bacterium]|nr:AIDA repeat-containing protein [Lentisphaeria bacterium]
ISSGASVTDIKENGGVVQVDSGAVVTFVQHTAENLTLTGSVTIHSGTVFKNATANNASVHIYSGGVADSILTNKGTLRIESGGSASIAFTPWEKAAITSDAGAVITYLDPTSQMYLGNFKSGLIGTANSYTEVTKSNYIHIYNSCYASGFKVNGGTFIMSQGASATETSINSSGRVSVCYGAQAQNTIVNAGGSMIVSNGGKADTTTVYSRGNISVLGGASASNIIVLNGGGIELAIEKGTFAQGESAGSAFDMRDGYLSGYRANAPTTIGNGGILYDTTLYNGNWNHGDRGLIISSGGLASKTSGSGAVNVCYGGSAKDTVLTGGGVNVYDGGVAENISLSNSARITVYGGASATGINANNGRAFIYQGASVSGMTFSRGDINIFSGATAEDIDITSAHLKFSGGGTASDTTINAGGHLFASSGAFADDTTINCWGNASVFAGGVMQDTSIKTGGKLTLVSGGLHKGELNIESGGSALAYAGTTIDFTVAGRTVQDGYLINDLSAIKYNPTYTITVSSDLEQGMYKLAQNAGSLNGTITINNENGSIGKISVNGESFEYNGVEYTLNNINSYLTLTVYNGEDITPCRTDIYGTGVSQILAWDKNKGTVGAIYNDGVNQVYWRGIWDWGDADASLWRVAGAGFFDGSDVLHDGVLLYNGKGDRFASWTNLSIGSYGYTDLWKVDGSFNTKTLADLDGNQYDDILIYDGNGSIGVVLDGTHYSDIWHVEEGGSSIWQLEGAGSFGEGMDKLVMLNKSNNHVYLWTNNDTSFETWNWSAKDAGKLASGWEIAAIGDFEGDGTDDIMVLDRSTNNVWVWDDGNSQTKRWRGTLGEGFEIEAVGDYNGDGKEDLLLREHNSGWGGLGYWGAGYAGNWVDFNARIETDTRISGSVFEIIA